MKIKRLISVISVILVICLTVSCLAACGMGLDKDKAKEDMIAFLREIKDGDFEGAKTYLHPSFTDDIEPFFNEVEENYDIDFQSGITILGYSGTYYAAYTSEVDGSAYELDFDIEISGKELDVTISVVENDLGYGIYGFRIDD